LLISIPDITYDCIKEFEVGLLKFVPVCLVFSLILTACGPGGSKNSGDSAPQKTALGADGLCTPEVIADTQTLKENGAKYLTKITDSFPEMMDESKKDQAMKKIEAAKSQIKKELTAYRSTYGDFSCRYYSNGYVYNIDPSPLYRSLQSMNAPGAPQPQSPIGRDGDCTPEFAADYRAMQKEIAVPVKKLLNALRDMGRNLANDESEADQEMRDARSAGFQALGISKKFRNGHPGEFACNMTGDNGSKIVVSSAQLDKSIAGMEDSILRLK
jgi:hypothetical protein